MSEKEKGALGTKVLIHALLCPREGHCHFKGCLMMKQVLKRVEQHTKNCSISNLPAGQDDCPTCKKWQSMIKLREHYRRKLITYLHSSNGAQMRGAAPPPAIEAAPPPLVEQFKKMPSPPVVKPDTGKDVAKVPSKSEAAKGGAKAAKGGGGSSNNMASLVSNLAGGSSSLLGAAAPMPPPARWGGPGGGGSQSRHDLWKATAIDDMLNDLAGPLDDREKRINKRPLPSDDGDAVDTAAAAEGGTKRKGKRDRGGKPKDVASADDGKGVVPKQSRSGRTLKATSRLMDTTTTDDDGSESGYSLNGYETIAAEESFMTVIEQGAHEVTQMGNAEQQRTADVGDALVVGQHVVFDVQRPSGAVAAGGPVPTEDDPRMALATSRRPAPSNVGRVTKLLARGGCVVSTVCNCGAGDGELQQPCDAAELAFMGNDVCHKCDAGKEVKLTLPTQRQIVCSSCFHVNLRMKLPTMYCSGCAKVIKSGQKYHKDHGERLNIKLCNGCYQDLTFGTKLELLPEDMDLDPSTFEIETWDANESVAYDFMVQCEGRCARWFHYCCAMYPDHVSLPQGYRLESETFVCDGCRAAGVSIEESPRLLALKERRAAHIRRHPLSDAIEGYLHDVLARNGVTARGLVVRVVSSRRFAFRALPSMKERYGPDYPDDFPYDSRAVFAFQEVGGRDVCVFAMYVQEYGPTCPRPNTGRTYISYLDSVRYLQAEPARVDGQSTRTLVYHAIINGYIADARDRGFEHAHIWVAPPQYGDEYIFHCHPVDPRHTKPMSMVKLREWYVGMLQSATSDKIVASFEDIQEHVSQLTSIRDFPLFEGDFFPDHLRAMLAPPTPTLSRGGPPMLGRESSSALAATLKGKTKAMRKRFLVASLQPRSNAPAQGALACTDDLVTAEISDELVDKRMDFLGAMKDRHWEWRELRRAHFSTMMVLAYVGGAP